MVTPTSSWVGAVTWTKSMKILNNVIYSILGGAWVHVFRYNDMEAKNIYGCFLCYLISIIHTIYRAQNQFEDSTFKPLDFNKQVKIHFFVASPPALCLLMEFCLSEWGL